MPLLEISNIVYGVGQDGVRPILSGLSLSIEPGEVHALLGTNGGRHQARSVWPAPS